MSTAKTEVQSIAQNGEALEEKKLEDNNAVPLSSFGLPRLYRDVEITLDNNLLPVEKLTCPPSLADGLDLETENRLRFLGCELIQTASILLKLPQVAAASGQLLYQRFYYCKSFIRCDFETVAMACVVLASKIEESPRKLRDVINVFNHIKQLRTKRKPQPLVLDQTYVKVKNEVKKQERRVLKELGFCVHIKHPHKLIVTYLKMLDLESDDRLLQKAWNHMNDGLRTDIFLRYSPETIACACIYLSARLVKVPLPNNWWEVFDATEDELKEICVTLLKMYSAQRPSWSRLERIVTDLHKKYMDSQQQKSKVVHEGSGGEENNTPKETKEFSPSQSRATSPKGGGIVDLQKDRDKGDRKSKSKRSPSGDRQSKRSSKERRKRNRSLSDSPSPKHRRKEVSSRNHSTKDSKDEKKRHRRHSSSESPPPKPLKQSQKKEKRREYSRSRSRSSSRERSKRRQRERELEVRQTLSKRRRSRSPEKQKLTSKYR